MAVWEYTDHVPTYTYQVIMKDGSEGEIFEVAPEAAFMSTLVKHMVDEGGTDEVIPLPNVKTAILSKVIDYCKHHKDAPAEEIPSDQ